MVGLGSKKDLDSNKARIVAGNASRLSIKENFNAFAIECFTPNNISSQSFGEGLVLGSYQFTEHKSNTEKFTDLKK